MMITNYALLLEQMAYKSSEPVLEGGPTNQNDEGLKNVLSGEKGGAYTNQWNQLIDDITAKKRKPGQYSISIKATNGKDIMVNLSYTIKADGKMDWASIALAQAEKAGSGSLQISGDKFLNFDAKGKLHEVVSAMIQVCIEKLGNDWGPNHVKWVNDQLGRAARSNTSCVGLSTAPAYSPGQGTQTSILGSDYATFLKTNGAVRTKILATNDAPSQINNIAALSNAGDAKTPELLDSVIAAIKSKLDETIVSETDETCLVNCYFLISPKITQAQIEASWQKLGFGKGGPLSAIVAEMDKPDYTRGKMLAVWALGSRLGKANPESVKACGLDVAAHNTAVEAIRNALV